MRDEFSETGFERDREKPGKNDQERKVSRDLEQPQRQEERSSDRKHDDCRASHRGTVERCDRPGKRSHGQRRRGGRELTRSVTLACGGSCFAHADPVGAPRRGRVDTLRSPAGCTARIARPSCRWLSIPPVTIPRCCIAGPQLGRVLHHGRRTSGWPRSDCRNCSMDSSPAYAAVAHQRGDAPRFSLTELR